MKTIRFSYKYAKKSGLLYFFTYKKKLWNFYLKMCENYENCAYSYTYTEEFSCNKAKKWSVAVEYGADLHNKI